MRLLTTRAMLIVASITTMSWFASQATATVILPGTWSNDFSFESGETITPSGASGSTFNQNITTNGNNAVIAPVGPQTLSVGDSISLTGTVAWNTTNIGNDQFRFGLLNTNGSANSLGWLGYIAELPNSGAGVLGGEKATANAWASGNNITNLTLAGGGTSVNNGSPDATTDGITYTRSFNFALTLTELTSSSYSVAVTFNASDATTTYAESATDAATPSDVNNVFNEIGLFFGSGTSIPTTVPQNTIAFSNVQVDYEAVPEPSSLVLLSMAGLGLAWSLMSRR